MNNLRQNRAYSLIEFALVLLIMGLMYSTIAPVYLKLVEEKREEDAVEAIQQLTLEIDSFFIANGYYPDNLGEIFNPVPLDPWGNPYQYTRIAGGAKKNMGKVRKDKNLVPINSDYDFYSMGPDGQSASPLTANISKDDIVRGRNGGYVGEAVAY